MSQRKYFIKLISFSFLLTISAYAGQKSLCGPDDRISFSDSKIGRLVKSLDDNRACTATLISNRCAISAGHCAEYYGFLEFDTPSTNSDGSFNHPHSKNIYPVDNTVDYEDLKKGDDWMVIRLNKNPVTGLYPGEERGYYQIAKTIPSAGSAIRIAGYGKDNELEKSYTLQVAYGKILNTPESSSLNHQVDTQGGNSGSAIIDEATNMIVGIHTNGGCRPVKESDTNSGTWIFKSDRLKNAIQECLAQDHE